MYEDEMSFFCREELLSVRAARQVSARHIANLSAADKKELLARKRVKELQRVLLPDAPPRKRRTLNPSPEREPPQMAASAAASQPAPPALLVPGEHEYAMPSTSRQPTPPPLLVPAEDIYAMPSTSRQPAPPALLVPGEHEYAMPSTSRQPTPPPLLVPAEDIYAMPSTSRQPTPPTLLVPAEDMYVGSPVDSVQSDVPSVGYETVVANTTPTRTRTRHSLTDDAITSFVNDSDFDDSDSDEDILRIPTTDRLIETGNLADLTPQQEAFLLAEDSANDRACQNYLPDDCFQFNWNKDVTTFKGRREEFSGSPGPTFDVTDMTPIDVFGRMFDVDFIDLLCEETNRYACQRISRGTHSASSRQNRWSPTNRPEIISFLALMILQGLFPLPREESYFSFNGFGTMPYFSRIMSYNRYNLLKVNLHFVDNDKLTDAPSRSKLCKIQPVTDYFNDKFSSLYYPRQEIAIDESLLKWHGRLSFAQKINTKAAQVGIKTYELCESSTGYLWRFIVYAGKNKPTTTMTTTMTDNNDDDDTDQTEQSSQNEQTEETSNMTDFTPTNATAKIVFDLMEPLLHRGHTLIMDNFYNCPLLARCLKLRRTDCYGTQRLNREFIPSSLRTMTKTDLRQGEVVASYCNDLSLMVWRDSNLVSMISTYHKLEIGTRTKYNRTAFKPSVVLDYNKNMGGIDRKDQYLSAQPLERVRNRVWYKKLFRRFLNAAVFNCFVIYSSKHKISHRQFRTVLAESLLKTYRQIDLTTETRHITRTRTTGSTTTETQQNVVANLRHRPTVESDHFPVHADPRTHTQQNRTVAAELNSGRLKILSQNSIASATLLLKVRDASTIAVPQTESECRTAVLSVDGDDRPLSSLATTSELTLQQELEKEMENCKEKKKAMPPNDEFDILGFVMTEKAIYDNRGERGVSKSTIINNE
ncbi:uncharacterized protein LOC123704546 [Colias croceus]|uniref:uncharacterized protein LOC123704546 n=1 Tax=Colias crocea TaxID=72248 RepID=UPI001E27CC5D|nr:uncharacterized protein LOC123704546 [Colias croceus]